MNLNPRTEAFGQEDQSWLASAHGTDAGVPVTLDVSTFTSGTHYPKGYLKSGIALGKITASGEYGPYNDAASDGTQTCVGFLFTSVPVNVADNTQDVQGVILRHGRVYSASVIGIDANGKADVAGRIDFV